VTLPSLNFEYSANVGHGLQKAGLKLSFNSDKADFSRLSSQRRLYIGDFVQTNRIEVFLIIYAIHIFAD
jgi:serine protease inhibitor